MIWDYDKTEYQKQAAADSVWHLKRLINYGLGEEKMDRELLKKYLPELRISEDRRFFRVTPIFFRSDEGELKVEFAKYPFHQLENMVEKDGVKVDSLRGIVEELKSFFVDLAREVGTGVIRD